MQPQILQNTAPLNEAAITPLMRARLAEQFLAPALNAPRPDKPTIYAMAGIPGAGKSTYVARAVMSGVFPPDAFILNPDRVMEALPDYHADVKTMGPQAAFARWEMPSRTLAYDLYAEAAAAGVAIIKDMGCVRQENWDMLQALKAKCYNVHMTHIYCTVAEAQRRCALRARPFPPAQIAMRAASLQALLECNHHVPDQLVVLDNTDYTNPFKPLASGATYEP